MKLIQLNFWQGRLLQQLLDFLRQEKPDILTAQEVYSSPLNSPLFDFLCSYEALQALFPTYHAYFSPAYDMHILDTTFAMGTATISRFPLSDQATTFINGGYRSYKSLDDYIPNTRNLQQMTVHPDRGASFSLFNHHGFWDKNCLGSAETVHKMQRVADLIVAAPRPAILSGDLNIVPASPAMRPVQSFMRDLTKEYRLRSTLTKFGKVRGVACDHICVTPDIRVHSFRAHPIVVSDHKPLILEFDLPH